MLFKNKKKKAICKKKNQNRTLVIRCYCRDFKGILSLLTKQTGVWLQHPPSPFYTVLEHSISFDIYNPNRLFICTKKSYGIFLDCYYFTKLLKYKAKQICVTSSCSHWKHLNVHILKYIYTENLNWVQISWRHSFKHHILQNSLWYS